MADKPRWLDEGGFLTVKAVGREAYQSLKEAAAAGAVAVSSGPSIALAILDHYKDSENRWKDCGAAGSWWGYSAEAVERHLGRVASFAQAHGCSVDHALERVLAVGLSAYVEEVRAKEGGA